MTTVAKPCPAAGRAERQPRRTVADDGDVEVRTRHSGALERGHPAELLDDVGAGVGWVDRAVHRLDVDGDAAGLAPRTEVVAGVDEAAISRAASKASTPASWRAVASRSTKLR